MSATPIVDLLDQVRAIAQSGLGYAPDEYDRARYERLLLIAGREYAAIAGIDDGDVLERFRAELAWVSPRVGVDAVVYDDDGKILFIRRSDDECWGFPGGGLEVWESPQECAVREASEETGLVVEIAGLLGVWSRRAGDFGQPYGSCHIAFHCVATGGTIGPTSEALEVAYRIPADVDGWHKDHQTLAHMAEAYWRSNVARAADTKEGTH